METKCHECRAAMMASVENYRYDLGGLPNVVLVGVTVYRCPTCGSDEVAIPRLSQLHRAIVRALVAKRGRLSADEIRFLRKRLEWTGVELAARLGVTPDTASRWQTGKRPINPTADRLLRLYVAYIERLTAMADALRDVEETGASPVHLRMEDGGGGWQAQAA